MVSFSTLLINVFLFTLLMLPGYVLARAKKIHITDINGLTNILMYVAMPALTISKLLEMDISAIEITGIASCIVFPFVVIGIIFCVSKLFFKNAVAKFCVIFSNCGFFGIPLATVLFPDAPEVVVYLAIFNVVSTFLLLTFGVFLLSGNRDVIRMKGAICSPIGISILVGILCIVLKIPQQFPIVVTYVSTLANLTTPLSMLVLGVLLAQMKPKSFLCKDLISAAFLKLVFAPLITMGLLGILIYGFRLPIQTEAVTALFIATAVSTAASAPAMAEKYGNDGEYATMLTLGTTILCVMTLPLLFLLFDYLF